MGIQATLNQHAINMLDDVKSVMTRAESFNKNQMRQYTYRAIVNSKKAIDSMSDKELKKFQSNLISIFKEKNWIE